MGLSRSMLFDCVSHSNHVIIIIMFSILPPHGWDNPVMVSVIVLHNLRLHKYTHSSTLTRCLFYWLGSVLFVLSRAHFHEFWVTLIYNIHNDLVHEFWKWASFCIPVHPSISNEISLKHVKTNKLHFILWQTCVFAPYKINVMSSGFV